MNKAWKVFRAIVSALLLFVVVFPAAVYVLLSLDPVRSAIRKAASEQLTELLGADVAIDRVDIHPFRRLSVKGVSVTLGSDTVATVSTVSAGMEIFPLILRGDFVIDYALVDGLNLKVWRETPHSPLNVQPILSRLKSGNPGNKKAFNLEISTVIVRNAGASYDVLSVPYNDSTVFNPAHIGVSDLAINAFIPQISDKAYRVSLDHLSFVEQSGFVLKKLAANAYFGPNELYLNDAIISLPHSSLTLAPIDINYPSQSKIMATLRANAIDISADGSVYGPDFGAFVPVLNEIRETIDFAVDARASLDAVDIRRLTVTDKGERLFRLNVEGNVNHLTNKEELTYNLHRGRLELNCPELVKVLAPIIPPATGRKIAKVPPLMLAVSGEGSPVDGNIDLTSKGLAGNIELNATYHKAASATEIEAVAKLDNFNLAVATGDSRFGRIDAKIEGDVKLAKKLLGADVQAKISRIGYDGINLSNINANVKMQRNSELDVVLAVNDPALRLNVDGRYVSVKNSPSLAAAIDIERADLKALGLKMNREQHLLGANIDIEADGLQPDAPSGKLTVSNFSWLSSDGEGMKMDRLELSAATDNHFTTLSFNSPYITGALAGRCDFAALVPSLKELVMHFIPALNSGDKFMPGHSRTADFGRGDNIFDFDFDIKPCPELCEFLGLPVSIVYDATLNGKVDTRAGYASLMLHAPYIFQGTKVIENTTLFAELNKPVNSSMVYATTQFPTKKGDMNLAATVNALNNKVDAHIDWGLDRRIPLNGTMGISANLISMNSRPGDLFPLEASIAFTPGTLNFGNDTWNIEKSTIDIQPDKVKINGFALHTDKQRIAIEGTAGNEPSDTIMVALSDIRLLHIFETLEIDNVLIDGRATGRVTATDLFGAEPTLVCPALHVDSIGYNRCYFGDADVMAAWDNENKAVSLNALLNGFEGKKSNIYGNIYPAGEALDLNFEADSIPVGFLKPFMAAFTSDISGRASGKCHLFGSFKEIDLEGDVFADDVKIKVDFTNVTYSATDSVHIRPGSIKLNNITIHDPEGHTANLYGLVEHTFFKSPVFRFDITGAHDFLSYDTNPTLNPDWYGVLYGNGGASISGYPGVVNINVDMTTGPNSSFTFVLSDRLDAEDYSFLTFRDATPDSLKNEVKVVDDTPDFIRAMKDLHAQGEPETPSEYNMDIRVNVTPQADMTLVMDPAGGDEIKAEGDGSIHLAYHSANNDLNIWGKYRVMSGSYRFTLQDIIIKDFIIKEGSEIQFDGDPYAVKTKLTAYYGTTANLSDLDESFQQDKEVARTNVPVHAIMNVTGDIRQPVIDFDLEFPTLTQDTYRKVRSIVSTSDMMNRQIIYLLALNKFYTPDYMASTKGSEFNGSELFSVASSTISSQLGNMLGKLSDKWSIAPNLRSDRGDFSDVEVDVALSSRLLNNRLIFNGNFGYRDKTLNTNQFVGDFDVEYLLDKRGIWRLKAYNRYNDRNYYVRTAQTTQGIGIMFRRDFDSLLSFLKKSRKEEAVVDTAALSATD